MTEAIRQGDIPGVQLRCRSELSLSPQAVWPWFAEPDKLASILERKVSAARSDGVAFECVGGAEREARVSDIIVMIGSQAPRFWQATWRQPDWPISTRVTVGLTPLPSGVSVSVFQEGFEHLPLSDCLTVWETYRRRWREALDRLSGFTSSAG